MAGKTLAELRATAKVRLPEWTHELCLAQDLVARVQVLNTEQNDLTLEVAQLKFDLGVGTDGAEDGKKGRRVADPKMTRLREAEARLKAIPDDLAVVHEEMREHTGELVMRAIPAGEWRRWVDENPARVEKRDDQNRPILNPLDEQYVAGLCNADALANSLRRFVVSWNGEAVTDEDWSYLLENAASGDIKAMCQTVVARHEGPGARAPKASSTVSSGTRSSAKS
jgi:hypothetical protein